MSISLLNLHPPPADLQRLVREGMRRSPRQLPAWMLYDAEGSRLFAEICRQPEYTLTQREIALLVDNAAAIAAAKRASKSDESKSRDGGSFVRGATGDDPTAARPAGGG